MADTGLDREDIDEDDVLTDWERAFLASVGGQDYPLTPAQQDKLEEIEAAIPERMERLRQERWLASRP